MGAPVHELLTDVPTPAHSRPPPVHHTGQYRGSARTAPWSFLCRVGRFNDARVAEQPSAAARASSMPPSDGHFVGKRQSAPRAGYPQGMWEARPPDFLSIAEALYDVHAPPTAWFAQTFEAARQSLPGVELGTVAVTALDGAAKELNVHRQDLWASNDVLLDAALDYGGRSTKSYLAERLVNPAATDWQLMAGALEEVVHWDYLKRHYGAEDCFALAACDDGLLVVLGGLLPARAGTWPSALVEAWERIAFHLLSATQLRRAIAKGRARPEAVLRPDGALLEAHGAAQGRRDLLRDSVRQIERSRGRWRDKPEPSQARTPTIDARWTLVDEFESDGRHFIVAYAADAEPHADSVLSAQERRVAEHIVAGWSMKRIAYCLGLSSGTVASYTHRACQKLGVRGRVALGHALRRDDGVTDPEG